MVGWVLFLHIAAVLGLMLAHGVQMTVTWKARWEPDPARCLALFDTLPDVRYLRYAAATVLVSGLLLALVTSPWRAWIWVSVVLFAAIWAGMWRWGGGYFELIDVSASRALEARGTADEAAALYAFADARRAGHPIGLTLGGVGGLGGILALMIFKPF